jgi:hypothetical protein
MYKLLLNPITNQLDKVMLTLNKTVIVFGTDNPDSSNYQQYLKWVAEGNTPESADEGKTPA